MIICKTLAIKPISQKIYYESYSRKCNEAVYGKKKKSTVVLILFSLNLSTSWEPKVMCLKTGCHPGVRLIWVHIPVVAIYYIFTLEQLTLAISLFI